LLAPCARQTRAFTKAIGAVEEFDLLSAVGRMQIGRIRSSVGDARLDDAVGVSGDPSLACI
jgi:hypothetical protein